MAIYGDDRYFLFYNSMEVAELPIQISVDCRMIICEHIRVKLVGSHKLNEQGSFEFIIDNNS